jgi:sec-independent protein translocase protein TatC
MTDASPPPEGAQETFISHLIELRSRLLRSIVAVVIVLLCLVPWAKQIYAVLAAPLMRALPPGATMIATDVTGTFLVPLKVTLMAAFLLALPYVLWQVWAFVAPGLYQHERKLALPVLASSFVCFVAGMAFAYFAVFPIAFGFFAGYAPAGVTMMTDIDKYLSFVLTMFIAFGITFETPVVVIVLVRFRVVSLEKLRGIRPYVIVGATVIGAIFTPPDVVSQLLLAIPLWLLYELGLVLARFVEPPGRRRDAGRGEGSVVTAPWGALPTVTSTSRASRSCTILTLTTWPGGSSAMRASNAGVSRVGLPSISITMSCAWMPARSAGPPRTTPRMATPPSADRVASLA